MIFIKLLKVTRSYFRVEQKGRNVWLKVKGLGGSTQIQRLELKILLTSSCFCYLHSKNTKKKINYMNRIHVGPLVSDASISGHHRHPSVQGDELLVKTNNLKKQTNKPINNSGWLNKHDYWNHICLFGMIEALSNHLDKREQVCQVKSVFHLESSYNLFQVCSVLWFQTLDT